MINESPAPHNWRHSKWLALAEFAIVLAIFVADWHRHIFFSKTPYLFLLGWISLRLRGLRWKSVGLVVYRNWRATLALGVAGGIGMGVIQLFITQPLLVGWTGKVADLSDFQPLIGNVTLLLLFLILAWILAAFGEEMVYRGYFMNRVADYAANKRLGGTMSFVIVSVLFGFAHMDQGVTGMIDEGIMGALLAVLYLGCGRSLAVPIVAHGVADTVDLLLLFFGKYPGMSQ